MRYDNIAMLEDTLAILEKGYYEKDGTRTDLKLSAEERKEVRVFLPEDVEKICESTGFPHMLRLERLSTSCENMDSFQFARKCMKERGYGYVPGKQPEILVLNMANAVHPGGGVRRGANAQEEDLCRKSSLLPSLEQEAAAPYYTFNRQLDTLMGSDGMILTPRVEIIKDEKGEPLEDTVVVSVLTCAAPCLINGKEGLTEEQYLALMRKRITGMLKVCAYLGYHELVLSAFGCGAFQNDAKVVSDIFYDVLKTFDYDGLKDKDCFTHVDFAVLDRSAEQYNYKEFSRNFSDYYEKEDAEEVVRLAALEKKAALQKDRIRGSLFGGAAGDALGYPVEFCEESAIDAAYGEGGITAYKKDSATGKALISDDTQMSLFTAAGLLLYRERRSLRMRAAAPSYYVLLSYLEWLKTQQLTREEAAAAAEKSPIPLMKVPELYQKRAPGCTCLSALSDPKVVRPDFIAKPLNDSCGCGGVMRVAPVAMALFPGDFGSIEEIDREAAQIAAITHGNSLGYMPAAVLGHIVSRLITAEEPAVLEDVTREALDTATVLFAGDKNLKRLAELTEKAILLSKNDREDRENIHELGEGWTGHEALAISLYCALKYRNDFSAGIIAAVNHNGDSDSTGAVTGNILGALLGYDAIENKWKEDLEISDVILQMADELAQSTEE